MRIIGPTEIDRALAYGPLIERLREAFRSGGEVPVRHHHTVPTPGAADATLLLMPAWQTGRHIGVKIVTVFPDNGGRNLPAVMGSYLLLDGQTGTPLAQIDGPALTARRTAAASALAASYLARADAARLLMVGTGALAPHLIPAHAATRPIREVQVWGRDPAKAQWLAERLNRPDFSVSATADLEESVRWAAIVSCATLARQPLVKGAWLQSGVHLDLVGGFTPDMREADDDAVRRARIYVDTRAGATVEAGDIVQPLRNGVIVDADIRGDLFDLTRGAAMGRGGADEVTLFKSVGTALEDLAAAQLAVES
jgi:alanine dehydrogenase